MSRIRTRYRHPDRATAEAAEESARRKACECNMAMDAILNGLVAWTRGRYYHVGRWGKERSDGGYYIVRWMATGLDQRPSSTVYSDGEFRDFYRERYAISDDAELRELRDLMGKALCM